MSNSNTMIYILLMVINMAYLMYAIVFSGRDPRKKFYQKLLSPTTFAIHLSASGLLTILGLILARKVHELYIIMTGPMIFLLLLFLSNQVTRALYGRNVIFLFKGDKKPKEFVWYVDGVLGFACLLVSIVLPAYLTAYFRPFHEVRIGVTNG